MMRNILILTVIMGIGMISWYDVEASDNSQDEAIKQKLQQRDNTLLEQAKQAYLNDECMDTLDIMKLYGSANLTSDDTRMLADIKTC